MRERNLRKLRLLWCSILSIFAIACSDVASEPLTAPTKCSQVECPMTGTICSESDGLCHCGTTDGPVCTGEEACFPDRNECQMIPKCQIGLQWMPGMMAFVDRTKEWGLEAIGAQGIRIASGDFNQDGFADLLVRSGGNKEDDFTPDGVRRTWFLINDRNGGFLDETISSNLRQTRSGHPETVGRPGEVVAFADVDNNGTVDIYTGMTTGVEDALESETSELMLNDGQGVFTFADIDSELRAQFRDDAVAGASFVDFDRDGNIDLWLGQGAYTPAGSSGLKLVADRLLRGDGSGFFFDISDEAGLSTEEWSDREALNDGRAHSRAWSSLACDLNNDGNPELMAASYGRAPNLLWQSSRLDDQVRYENRSVVSGYAYDTDREWGSNEFAKCYCQANPGAEDCADVPAPRIQCPSRSNWNHSRDREAFRLGGNSGTSVCADLNNDGFMDILTTEITHWWAGANSDRTEILLNTKDEAVRFERIGNDVIGLARNNPAVNWDNGDMTAAVFDFDNDGWQDVFIGASDYAGNHGLLFQQYQPLTFRELPVSEGIDHNRSHGLAVADFDRDGDLDIVLGHSRSRCDATRPNNCYETRQIRFFENVIGEQGNWVQLQLVGGENTNADAIGARITFEANALTQTRIIDGGHGHYGVQHDKQVHFGLGMACEGKITITWPDSTLSRQEFTVYSGYRYLVEQGKEPRVIP